MKILKPQNLAVFRGPGRCHWCGLRVRNREAAHARGKGMGGCYQNDDACNLLALCAPFSGGRDCHARHHAKGEPSQKALIACIAEREGIPFDQLVQWLADVRRAPKDGPVPPKPWEVRDDCTRTTARHSEAYWGPADDPADTQDGEGAGHSVPRGKDRAASRRGHAADDPADEARTVRGTF